MVVANLEQVYRHDYGTGTYNVILEGMMRIDEKSQKTCEGYTASLQQHVGDVLVYTYRIAEFKKLRAALETEAVNLRKAFLSEEDRRTIEEAVSFFDARMQATVYYTLKNLDGYQQYGWKKIIYEGEEEDGGTGQTVQDG